MNDDIFFKTFIPVKPLNEEESVQLVRNGSGECFVKKELVIFNEEVFRYMQYHPVQGIPKVYDIWRTDGGAKLVVLEEYIPGITLEELLKRRGPLPLKEAERIMRLLCKILHKLHHFKPPLVHRDIKPSNVIMNSKGEIYLIDLNTMRFSDGTKTRDTRLLGTEGYAAPEQYGFSEATVTADIYALGVLYNELLTGHWPKYGLPSGYVKKVIVKCTHMDPESRFQSVDELKHYLKHGLVSVRKTRWNISFLPPGFRTGNILHMVLALAGYAAIVGLPMSIWKFYGPPIFVPVIVFLLLVLWISMDYLEIWERIGITKIKNLFLRILAIIGLLIFFTGIYVGIILPILVIALERAML